LKQIALEEENARQKLVEESERQKLAEEKAKQRLSEKKEKQRLAKITKQKQTALDEERKKFSNLEQKISPLCNYNAAEQIYNYVFFGQRIQQPILDILISIMKQQGLDLDKSKAKKTTQLVMIGYGKNENRELPACIEKIILPLINASEAQRQNECYMVAYLSDHKFRKTRQIKTFSCKNSASEIENWINLNHAQMVNITP